MVTNEGSEPDLMDSVHFLTRHFNALLLVPREVSLLITVSDTDNEDNTVVLLNGDSVAALLRCLWHKLSAKSCLHSKRASAGFTTVGEYVTHYRNNAWIEPVEQDVLLYSW